MGQKCHLNMGQKLPFAMVTSLSFCYLLAMFTRFKRIFFPLADSKKNLIFFCHLKFCHNIKIYFCSSRFSYLRNSFIRASIKITQYYFLQTFKGGVYCSMYIDWTIYFWVCFFFQFWWVEYYNERGPSPSVITFFPISEFSCKLIRFLLHSSIIKSDNEIGKFS